MPFRKLNGHNVPMPNSSSTSSQAASPIERGTLPLRQKNEARNGIVTPTFSDIPKKTSSLEELQTEEQRTVLDTIAKVRKCGLEGEISLPQIVVCTNNVDYFCLRN